MSFNFVPVKTIVFREVRRCFRIWKQVFIPPLITTTLYFLIFGQIIGERLNGLFEISFLEFIVPGLILMNVITSSYMNSSFTFFGAKWQRYIEEILVSPMTTNQMILGFAIPSIIRSFLVSIIIYLASLFFLKIQIENILLCLLVLVLTSFLFSLLGLLNSLFAKSFDEINIVPNFILTPLTYLGGVFFSIEILSSFWKGVALINPIYYIIDLFRYTFYGLQTTNVFIGLSILIFLNIFVFILLTNLIKKGVGLRS